MTADPHIHRPRRTFSASSVVDAQNAILTAIKTEDGATWADIGRVLGKSEDRAAAYREQYYLERAEPDRYDKRYEAWTVSMQAARDRVELIAAKVRNGRVGRRLCYFFGEHQAVRGSNFFTGDDR